MKRIKFGQPGFRDTARQPTSGSVEDFGESESNAHQLALQAANSGAHDVPDIQAMPGHQMPAQELIDATAAYKIATITVQISEHDMVAGQLVEEAQQGRSELRERRDKLQKDRDKEEAQLAGLQRVLTGAEKASNGRGYPGKTPRTPTVQGDCPLRALTMLLIMLRPEALLVFISGTGFTLLVAAAELTVLRDTLRQLLRSDSVLTTLLYAVTAVVGLAVLPHVIGRMTGEWLRQGPAPRRAEVALIVALTGFWAAAVVVIAKVRTDVEQQGTVRRLAATRAVAPEDIDPASVFNWASSAALFGLFLALGGVAVAAVKIFNNPKYADAVKVTTVVALLHLRLREIEARLDRVDTEVRKQQLIRETGQQAWAAYPAVIKAHAEVQKRLFDVHYVQAVADPPHTTAYRSSRAEAPSWNSASAHSRSEGAALGSELPAAARNGKSVGPR